MKTHQLNIKWTTSKARDTYGYNICTLWDGAKRYSCNGGGYDMLGTVFGYWLWFMYADRIKAQVKPDGVPGGMYGYFVRDNWSGLEGATGLDCMRQIAIEIGLSYMGICDKKGRLTNIIISETE